MKIKTLVLICLIVFGLGFAGVLAADFATQGKTANQNDAVGVSTDAASGQVTSETPPVVTPGGTGTSSSPSPASGGGSSASGSSGTAGGSATSVAPKPATSSTPVATTPKPTTSAAPAAPACGSAGGACTTAQVATHNSQSNCWVIYNGGYYNVTAYVNAHPGGKSVFSSTTCGHDITAYLNGNSSVAGQQHKHANSAYTVLNSYYVGKVQ
ncbi:MAG: cytochrome b5-like heme/steroid binding domain-containing protein [Candidatus Saccharibacteria bacterium]